MTERRKTTHEGITHPRFATRTACKPRKAPGAPAKFAGDIESLTQVCYSHAVQSPKPAEFCYSHAVQSPKPAGFCYSHGVQGPKPAGFCYSHAVQALKPAGFCYLHAVQSPKPAEFCYSHGVQGSKGARGAGQVCRRHRIPPSFASIYLCPHEKTIHKQGLNEASWHYPST